MKSLLLINGDIVVSNDDLQLVNGVEEIKQCVEVALGTNKGEWFLNHDIGLTFDRVLGKATDEQIRSEVSLTIGQEIRINTIDRLEITRNKKERVSEVYFEATSTDEENFSGEVNINA